MPITKLVYDCWAGFQRVKSEPYVVSKAIPILWFGDIDAYMNSDLRIITVCTHPSYYEFADKTTIIGPSMRFPNAVPLVGKRTLSAADMVTYETALNSYFTNKSTHGLTYYKKWFNHFEEALNGINASYFSGKYPRTSVHIDYYTPVAVEGWGGKKAKITQSDIKFLCANKGYSFADLLNALDPDVIIACLNEPLVSNNFEDVYGFPCTSANVIHRFSKSSSVYIRSFELKDKGHTRANRVLIWGNNGDVPFARIGYTDLATQMGIIKGIYHL